MTVTTSPRHANSPAAQPIEASKDKKATPWIGVSNAVIGRILAAAKVDARSTAKCSSAESSKARAPLLKWAFVKVFEEGRGNHQGFAANRVRLTETAKEYRFTRWEVEQLVRLERRSGALRSHRHQPRHNGRAVEAPLPRGGSEARMPVSALRLPSKLFAFIVVTLLSPKPQRPLDVSGRFGIKDGETVNRLARDAAATELIELRRGPHGKVLVGRSGADFAGAFNTPQRQNAESLVPKNLSTENVSTHFNWKEGTSTEGKTIQPEDRQTEHTRIASRWRADAPKTAARQVQLRDWRSAPNDDVDGADKPMSQVLADEFGDLSANRHCPPSDVERAACPDFVYASTAERLGELPEHLTDEWAYGQVIDIARELAAAADSQISMTDAVIGVAGEISKAVHREGREIVNLAFIAYRLLGKVQRGNLTWSFDLPSKLNRPDAKLARSDSEQLATFAEQCGHRIDRRALTATLGFERLHDLLQLLGEGDRVRGWEIICSAIKRARRGDLFANWPDFIAATEAAQKRSEAARR